VPSASGQLVQKDSPRRLKHLRGILSFLLDYGVYFWVCIVKCAKSRVEYTFWPITLSLIIGFFYSLLNLLVII
jgi:hypothetical protein